MRISELVCTLVSASEKAATIARTIRLEQTLFELLVEEKEGIEKNQRFIRDFKTLGDVLVQEVVRHDVGKQFPGLKEHILGEESNEFTNVLGETIKVAVQPTPQQTCDLLAKVLDGNSDAATLLAKVVHEDIKVAPHPRLTMLDVEVPLEEVGVWIDPIDSTYQYINGKRGSQDDHNVITHGLPCVTVLIGAYSRETGKPIAGIVNQPFVNLDESKSSWTGEHVWGISCDGCNLTSYDSKSEVPQVVITSTSEDQHIREVLEKEYQISYSAGAGFKTLCVAKHLGCAYILSHPTTYKWDTCAPHALLLAEGGGIVDFQSGMKLVENATDKSKEDLEQALENLQLKYNRPDELAEERGQPWCNTGGLVAYSKSKDLLSILNLLSQDG